MTLLRHVCQAATLKEIEAYIRTRQLAVDNTYAIQMSLVSICLSYITETGGNIDSILGEQFRPYEQIRKIASLEDSFHLDSSYIRKPFSKAFNMNVAEYITHVRMKQAKLLMDTENMKLQELSEQVGYSDAGYFSKVIKKYNGILPSEYSAKKGITP